jgi:hypothetical protein
MPSRDAGQCLGGEEVDRIGSGIGSVEAFARSQIDEWIGRCKSLFVPSLQFPYDFIKEIHFLIDLPLE